MKKRTRVLLTNAYAVNNGDMALVLALSESLKKRGFDVSIATFYYNFLKEKYPEVKFVRELLDHKKTTGSTAVKTLFLKLNFLFNKTYRGFDVYISSPGGYMNSYYGLKKCLLPLIQAKKTNKKTAVYSQSVGPLNERDRNLLNQYSQFIDTILVRDSFSKKCIDSTRCNSKILQTKDAAFLLEPRVSIAKNSKLVAVSVRSWKHDSRNMEQYYALIQKLCEKLLDKGFDIEFISTCQGIKDYVDDSKTASLISDAILQKNGDYAGRINIVTSFHTYFKLTDLLNSRYCFVVGTRLHMCILSLINGIPAFNISYEIKGKECYEYLNLSDYSVDFNEPAPEALRKFDLFLTNQVSLKKSIYKDMLSVHNECQDDLDLFIKQMDMQASC